MSKASCSRTARCGWSAISAASSCSAAAVCRWFRPVSCRAACPFPRIMTSRSLPLGLARLGALLCGSLWIAAPWPACAQVLPPPPIGSAEPDRMPAEARLWVKSFRFEGNWVFSDAELAGVTRPFTGRELDAGELEEARRAVTLHYISRGYLSSGAVLPDQDPIDGVVVMKIVEGRLTEIHLEGNRWLSDRYLTGRLQRWSSPVLNLLELQDGLQQLRQNPNVDQINAELKPGPVP
ncbi:MAG: ShlB/FhaC/HecB family hemolysin secretion/activation protein, partial [Methylococcus sp.]